MKVVVLSCGALGAEVAASLVSVPSVRGVALVTAPYRRRPLSLRDKVKQIYRAQGLPGFASVVAAKLFLPLSAAPAEVPAGPEDSRIERHRADDFHSPDCLRWIRELAPDLGVVAGTYILREEVFSIPRLGSINLHSGKAPEYRGAAPAFWELYHGEPHVGITIHRVTAALDAGNILGQELFPLDPAPAGDPLVYLERYRETVLQPQAIRMMAEAVAAIGAGTVEERPQDLTRARTYRTPDYRAVRELRRRVAERRRKERTQ